MARTKQTDRKSMASKPGKFRQTDERRNYVKLIHVRRPYNATHLDRRADRPSSLPQNFVKTDERRKITSIQLPIPLLFPLNTMVPEDRGK